MSETTTNRHVDIAGLPFPAESRWDGETCTIRADDVTSADLDAAVAAAPTVPDPAVTAENRATIEDAVRAHLADLRTITASSGSLSNAQLSNAARVLARGQIRLIRLAVGLLDGTD